ncbi:hypothetical protein AVEN_37444-1 [Araneus ventricosus]|uniref:Uncharacterized protein n=1 Tax=Araneus ventricosus TaxID=182803 RepID=A0A4Y2FBD2_ARAVE|nr:hypothetical protein AVEN_37444-1 [Araneus ventricosus]
MQLFISPFSLQQNFFTLFQDRACELRKQGQHTTLAGLYSIYYSNRDFLFINQNFFSINTVDSRLTGFGLSGTTPLPPKRKRRLRPLECAGRPHSSQLFLLFGLVQPTLSPDRLQLNYSEDVNEEAVEQCINEDSTLECCEVLSDDDIVSRLTCSSQETRNFEECPESDEENLETHQKLSHGDALVHTEALLNYLEQEDESTPAEKVILRNLCSIIR